MSQNYRLERSVVVQPSRLTLTRPQQELQPFANGVQHAERGARRLAGLVTK